jgi:hypothetical protein
LSVFGYPISSEQQVNGFTAQWLERNRFELHPENNAPYNVLLGLLGVEALAKKGIKWQTLPTVTVDNTPDGCRFFKETGHSLCSDFKKYWEQNGLRFDPNSNLVYSYQESLALFGYPISEPKVETNSSGDQVLTQWFERARFELHPNNPEIFKVELGLLGNELKP